MMMRPFASFSGLVLALGITLVCLLACYYVLRFVYAWANDVRKAFYAFLGSALGVRFFYFLCNYNFEFSKSVAGVLRWSFGLCMIMCFVFVFILIFKMYKMRK